MLCTVCDDVFQRKPTTALAQPREDQSVAGGAPPALVAVYLDQHPAFPWLAAALDTSLNL